MGHEWPHYFTGREIAASCSDLLIAATAGFKSAFYALEELNKPRWYPQQSQRFIFTNLSEACCEAKRWKHVRWVSVSSMAANPGEPYLALHQSVPSPEPSPEPCRT